MALTANVIFDDTDVSFSEDDARKARKRQKRDMGSNHNPQPPTRKLGTADRAELSLSGFVGQCMFGLFHFGGDRTNDADAEFPKFGFFGFDR